MQPVRRGPRIASRTTTAQRIAQMQPVRRGPRIARRTRVTRPPRMGPHTLRSTLRWFRLVRDTNFSKIQYIYTFLFPKFS